MNLRESQEAQLALWERVIAREPTWEQQRERLEREYTDALRKIEDDERYALSQVERLRKELGSLPA